MNLGDASDMCVLVTQLCPTLVTQLSIVFQAPLSMGFPRQESWSGLPFPSPGDLPDPGIDPMSLALQDDSLPLSSREAILAVACQIYQNEVLLDCVKIMASFVFFFLPSFLFSSLPSFLLCFPSFLHLC